MTSQTPDAAGEAGAADARERSHEEVQRLLRAEIAELKAALAEKPAVSTEDLEHAVEQRVAALRHRHAVELVLVNMRHAVRQDGPAAGVPDLEKQIAALDGSPLFDSAWYLAGNPDLADLQMSPAEHHARTGAFEGRDPGPAFDTMGYYLANPDIAKAGWPALVHYALYGKAEGRPLQPAPQTV